MFHLTNHHVLYECAHEFEIHLIINECGVSGATRHDAYIRARAGIYRTVNRTCIARIIGADCPNATDKRGKLYSSSRKRKEKMRSRGYDKLLGHPARPKLFATSVPRGESTPCENTHTARIFNNLPG